MNAETFNQFLEFTKGFFQNWYAIEGVLFGLLTMSALSLISILIARLLIRFI